MVMNISFMYSKNRGNRDKKAQSFLEYSLVIAVTVAVLILMQYYLSRNFQGLLKSHVDNLGGEKLSGEQYSPGKWYSGTSVTRIGTSGFDYEGRKGFQISTGTMQRSQVSKITGTPSTSELPVQNLTYQTLINGEDTALVNQVFGSSLDPGIATVQAQVSSNTPQWSSKTSTQEGQENDSSAGIDSQAESVVDKYVKAERSNIK